jgi:hypothetical protein
MKRLHAAACTLLAIAMPVAGAQKGTVIAVGAELGPRQMHEECVRLEAGDRRNYSWKSSGPVDFNVHYHRGDEVFYPVRRDGMRGDGGTFVAKTGEDYCWMWTARERAAKLEGRIAE